MNSDSWITLLVLATTVGALLLDRVPPVFVLGGAVASLMFGNVIDAEIALSGLSSSAPATIAALYVVAGAVTATGTFATVVDRLLDRKRPVIPLLAVTAAISSAVPNTPLVAMFAPRIVRWSQRNGANASRFLLPLSFASILGGVVTLIGTSTNLVVSDVLERSGEEPFGVVEVTVVGLPVAIIGVAILSTLGMRLLPVRTAAVDDFEFGGREFQVAARVAAGGPLVGRSIAESGLRNLDGVFLAMIERAAEPPSGGVEGNTFAASPNTVLLAGDVCCFVGDVGRVVDLHAFEGLVPLEAQHISHAQGAGTLMFEAVIAPASELVGATLKSAAFRGRYGGAVMAVHRSDGDLEGQLGRILLKAGDVLLVLADDSFARRWRSHKDFSLVAAADESPPERRGHSWLVVAATVGLVVTAAAGVLTLFEAAVAAALVVVVGGAISASEGWRAINLDVVMTMAVAISLGAAVAESGLAAEVAELVGHADALGLGDVGLVVVTMLATILLTELLTNTAAAALMVPVALSVAAAAGSEPRMLAVAVLIGASCSFLSPVGYQTNLMVFGLGGYRFSDFARVGAPLTLSTIATSAALIPIFFG